MNDDNLQHRLLREPARFIEDVRLTKVEPGEG
jgi:hypothetical protein